MKKLLIGLSLLSIGMVSCKKENVQTCKTVVSKRIDNDNGTVPPIPFYYVTYQVDGQQPVEEMTTEADYNANIVGTKKCY